MRVTVGKWGNDLGVRLSLELVDAIGLRAGERVDIGLQDGNLVIRRTEKRVALADLFRGKTPQAWRDEYAGAYEWGPDIRGEIVPE